MAYVTDNHAPALKLHPIQGSMRPIEARKKRASSGLSPLLGTPAPTKEGPTG